MKWTDTQDIAMALTDAHQSVDDEIKGIAGRICLKSLTNWRTKR